MREPIYFAKVRPDAIIPSKKDENAGYDVYANFEEEYMLIQPHETVMIPTGIASMCSPHYYLQLFERGSTGTKGIGQRCGVIDSGYRNEWFVPITNHNTYSMVIKKQNCKRTEDDFRRMFGNFTLFYPYEKAICQAVLLPVPQTQVIELTYEELLTNKSERGLGNLGSSNA
jgi:dUTP pyrophosphatase